MIEFLAMWFGGSLLVAFGYYLGFSFGRKQFLREGKDGGRWN